jgi:hypothetical protein
MRFCSQGCPQQVCVGEVGKEAWQEDPRDDSVGILGVIRRPREVMYLSQLCPLWLRGHSWPTLQDCASPCLVLISIFRELL